MKIYIGSDHAGIQLKNELKAIAFDDNHIIVDCGVFDAQPVDYPDIALLVAERVKSETSLGVLVCGTGIGMSIAANKVAGIRAALCQDPVTARLSREHNDANILVLGARIIGAQIASETVQAFLTGIFSNGRHSRRIEKIESIEKMEWEV